MLVSNVISNSAVLRAPTCAQSQTKDGLNKTAGLRAQDYRDFQASVQAFSVEGTGFGIPKPNDNLHTGFRV